MMDGLVHSTGIIIVGVEEDQITLKIVQNDEWKGTYFLPVERARGIAQELNAFADTVETLYGTDTDSSTDT